MAAADKKITIVIKKIEGGGGSAHGGSWKVAFADFMTAMMCFFLTMWLINQTPEVKAQVASYFSGPSMLEHDFTSYGAELTLEKLFLDLVNEPLKTAQDLLQPVDFTPNIMAMGSKKVALSFVASELGAIAKRVTVESDSVEFEIPEHYFFVPGTSNPSAQFVDIMTKLQAITVGLEDSRVHVESTILKNSVAEKSYDLARKIGQSRKDLISLKLKSSFEHPTNEVEGDVTVKDGTGEGTIYIKIQQKETTGDGRKPRPLEEVFDSRNKDLDVYNDFVKRITKEKKTK